MEPDGNKFVAHQSGSRYSHHQKLKPNNIKTSTASEGIGRQYRREICWHASIFYPLIPHPRAGMIENQRTRIIGMRCIRVLFQQKLQKYEKARLIRLSFLLANSDQWEWKTSTRFKCSRERFLCAQTRSLCCPSIFAVPRAPSRFCRAKIELLNSGINSKSEFILLCTERKPADVSFWNKLN